ncbi:MAG: FABP family protein [Verrucomicrobia bacterium]|nr:FABP family protein [Verrucomicrobiota bacterium]
MTRHQLLLPLLALSLSALAAEAPPAKAPRPDPWQPIRRLLGAWEGEAKGEPGTGRAERTYAFALRDRFIQVTNKSIYPPREKKPQGETHEDLGFLSYDRAKKKLMLRQFHVEGFVNTYELERVSDDGRTVVFVTTAIENIAPGWRGRETYTFVSDDEFTEKFELAEPGQDFALYSEARFRRKN